MRRFRLGTVSASAAWATIFVLVLFGGGYFALIPLLVYAVPCAAAFKKTPAAFWRPFTLTSLLVAAVVTAFATYGYSSVTLTVFP